MKRFKWVVEISVDPTWVEDGFDMSRFNDLTGNAAASERIRALIPYANSDEIKTRILHKPLKRDIKRVQE